MKENKENLEFKREKYKMNKMLVFKLKLDYQGHQKVRV